MLGSSSECVNSEKTDGTPKSISATPEPFQYVKKENDSKCSLRKSLASQRAVFLNAWHAEVIKSGCRLPLMSSTNSGVE
ncbi:hypothetical protein EG68_12522 [Paragonimus skrjabini miyazakii]|uniref:Uncharacterized protein n=1 Tax=Paragonimus skrjabini miyazakii TaxID=59628 RepID=A0A8S9YCQ8_9TREM|nr:hypothetical protein EG68_12522 [Paragonimus skrjabini miyazakii]